MNTIQPIYLRERLVALVFDGTAVIADTLPVEERFEVKAMCLFALELKAGERPGPYTPARALAYARQARVQRALAAHPEGAPDD